VRAASYAIQGREGWPPQCHQARVRAPPLLIYVMCPGGSADRHIASGPHGWGLFFPDLRRIAAGHPAPYGIDLPGAGARRRFGKTRFAANSVEARRTRDWRVPAVGMIAHTGIDGARGPRAGSRAAERRASHHYIAWATPHPHRSEGTRGTPYVGKVFAGWQFQAAREGERGQNSPTGAVCPSSRGAATRGTKRITRLVRLRSDGRGGAQNVEFSVCAGAISHSRATHEFYLNGAGPANTTAQVDGPPGRGLAGGTPAIGHRPTRSHAIAWVA